MTAHRPKTLVRALAGLLSLGVVLTPVLVAESGFAKKPRTVDVKFRKVSAPNVFYPVAGSAAVKDLRTFTQRHRATDIATPCKSTVRATHPGVATITTNSAWGGKYVVRVFSGSNALLTSYAYLYRPLVSNGQVIQSGQPLGVLAGNPMTHHCALQFAVSGAGKFVNASTWLNYFVGKTPPVSGLYNMRGINLASLNMLGASHTAAGSRSRYGTYPSRLVGAESLFNSRGLDVIGTQEFQEVQYDYFISKGFGNTFGAYYWDPAGNRRDTENAILYRKSTMEFVSGSTYDIPYFSGNTRHVPVVLLRQRSSGRTAYFLNVHNPADVHGPAAKWRNEAIAIERAKIIQLRATGRPVIITGDFNDRQNAFCPMTADKLTISPNSIPSMSCLYPAQTSIDWIFAAGQARFSYFLRDTYTQSAKISDHPIVIARTHLQN